VTRQLSRLQDRGIHNLTSRQEHLDERETHQHKCASGSRQPPSGPAPHGIGGFLFGGKSHANFGLMPPQPLSSFRPDADVHPSPEAILLRPKLAPYIAEIVAGWADIEANIGAMLSFILEAEFSVTAAMLSSIRSSSGQFDAVAAAGSAKLYDPDLELLEAILLVARGAAKKRNAIAHHIYGYSEALPEALLLIEPEAYAEVFVTINKSTAGGLKLPSFGPIMPDKRRTFVYREADFREIISEFKTVAKCVVLASLHLDPKVGKPDVFYTEVCAEPLIGAALTRVRNSRQPRPKPEASPDNVENGA
jgi:hypothetical protein